MEHLIHALGSERGSEDPGDRFASRNVGLMGFDPSQPRFLLLLFYYNEGPPVLVESQRHFLRVLQFRRRSEPLLLPLLVFQSLRRVGSEKKSAQVFERNVGSIFLFIRVFKALTTGFFVISKRILRPNFRPSCL